MKPNCSNPPTLVAAPPGCGRRPPQAHCLPHGRQAAIVPRALAGCGRAVALLLVAVALLGSVAATQAQITSTSPPAAAPWLITDKADYAPGESAVFAGGGFLAGETVVLQVLHANGTPATGDDHQPWSVTADGAGNFQTVWHVCEDDCLGSVLEVTASGQVSALFVSTRFTDATTLNLRVGYYDMSLGQGHPNQVAAIVTAGHTPVFLTDLTPGDLAGIDVLLVQNPDNSFFGSEYLSRLADIQAAVNAGMILIIHDRKVSSANSILPGGGGFAILRDFPDSSNVNVRDNTTPVTNGPGGVINDSTLDGGCSSSHGYAVAASLPATAQLVLSQGNPDHVVTFSYPFGDGHVIYSTIPLDAYLYSGSFFCNAPAFRDIYAPNIIAYGASLFCRGFNVAVFNAGGNLGFWQFGNLNPVMTTAPGVAASWNLTYINSLAAATLAPYDVLVITGAGRAMVTAQVLTDLANWVQAGGRLILDPLSAAVSPDPLLGGFGANYALSWDADWCGQVPAPVLASHPLLVSPNPLGFSDRCVDFFCCDHTSINPASLGTAWQPVVNLPSFGNRVVLAAAGYGAGALMAVGIHFDHNTPGQRLLAENMIRYFCNHVDQNQPPVAACTDVTVTADQTCSATVSIDAGSSDPDGDPITLVQTPAGPYPVGSTVVTLTVTDSQGASSSCQATVTVVDDTLPVITGCPADIVVGTGPGRATCDQVVTWTPPTATDNCSIASFTCSHLPGDTFPVGTTTVVCRAADPSGNTASCSFTVTVVDDTPPAIACPADILVNNDPGVCGALVAYAAPVGTDNCPGVATVQTAGLPSGAVFPVGTTVNTFEVTDAAGNKAACSFSVTVVDSQPPSIACPADVVVNADALVCTAVVNGLAPTSAADNCPGVTVAYALSGATSGTGLNDASGTVFNLGTTTVTYTATDAAGLTAACSFTVTVLNPDPVVTLTGPASGSLYAVNTPVTFSATFTDAGGGTHSGLWMFDSISQAATIVEPSGATPGSASATYTFPAAGVYSVKLFLNDSCGGAGSADQIGGTDLLVVVYDPSAGFVTGGGWINSPAGAYVADPTLTGKANFGFVSKYQKGANVPTGNTEFQFKAGDLNFKSAVYEWLVVAGAKAQYKGEGTINGAGSFNFLLTVTDGDLPGGGGADQFRIKITGPGGLVYDNSLGASDDMDAANPQTLAGGSIVIHKAK